MAPPPPPPRLPNISPSADEQTAQWNRPRRERAATSPPLGSKPPPLRTDGPVDKRPEAKAGDKPPSRPPTPSAPTAHGDVQSPGPGGWPVAQVARGTADPTDPQVADAATPERPAHLPPLGSASPPRRTDGPLEKPAAEGASDAPSQAAQAAAASPPQPTPAASDSPAEPSPEPEPDATQPIARVSAPQSPPHPDSSAPTGSAAPPAAPATTAPTTKPEATPPSVPPPRASQRAAPVSVRPSPSAATAAGEPEVAPARPADPAAEPPPVQPSPPTPPSRTSAAGAARPPAAAVAAVAPPPSRTSGAGAPPSPPSGDGPTADELGRAQRALEHSRKALGRAEGKIKDLIRETEALRDRIKQTERALDQKVDELEKFVGQHDSARALVAVRAERIRELEVALADRERAAAAEQRRLAAEHARRIADLQDEMRRRLADQELIVTDLRTQIGRFGTPKPVTDDLEQIRGIGPAFARKLRAVGVRTYAQIAGWSEDDIDDMAAKLQIHAARIRRADWVGSARELLTPKT